MWRYDIVLGEMNWNTVVCFTMVKQTKIVRQIWVPYPAKKYHDLMGCSWNRCAHILEAMIFVCEAHAERSVLTSTGIGKTSAKITFETPCDLPFVWKSGGTSMAERAILCCHCQNHLWHRQQLPNVFSRWNSCGKKHANPKSKWAKHDIDWMSRPLIYG